VMTVKGKFADGSNMLAVPNYARNNRILRRSQRPSADTASAAPAPQGSQNWSRNGRSIVWMREATDETQ
jgi:hypothetical protein